MIRRLAQVLFLAAAAVGIGCSSASDPVGPPHQPNAQLWVNSGYSGSPCYVAGPPILHSGKRFALDGIWSSASVYVAPGSPFSITQKFSQDPLTSFGGQYSCSFEGFVRLDNGGEFSGPGCTTSSVPADGLPLSCSITWTGVAP